jgi:prephenate dehydrogenase
MTAADHDEAVALVSHLPQVVSTLSAARLGHATPEALSLAGAGVRDVTRIAASDPGLWVQIVSANHSALLTHLRALRGDLDSVIEALQDISAKGAKAALAARFHEGVAGVSKLPGKHGVSSQLASLLVVIDDSPGELARLLTQLGQWDVNVEDLRLEHSPGANIGFAELSLAQGVVASVEEKLVKKGWKISGEME